MRWLPLALVSLFISSRVAADDKKAVAGKCSLSQGGVFRSQQENGPFHRLNEENEIFEGDYLKTEADARMEARLVDRSVLRLGPDSRLQVQQASFKKDDAEAPKSFSAKLIVGRMWAKVTKLFGDSKFDVTTPNAVAGVRGTAFGVDAGKDKSTTVRVYSGKVLVSNKPSYMIEGTKKFDGTQKPGERKQVAGPQEITKKQYEELVAAALQQIKVGANGQMDKPTQIAESETQKDEWIAWNRGRDAKEPGE